MHGGKYQGTRGVCVPATNADKHRKINAKITHWKHDDYYYIYYKFR